MHEVAETPVLKQEFARIIGKSAARVSQFISEGKIHGPALVGAGRLAKIVPSIAQRQLAAALDPVQQLGQGQPLAAALAPAPAAAADLFAAGPAVPADQDRYLKARADQAELVAERTKAENAALSGRWMVTAEAEAAWGAEMARFLQAIETHLVTTAAADVAALERPTAHEAGRVLRKGWLAFRARWTAAAEAPPVPTEVEDIGADGEVIEL